MLSEYLELIAAADRVLSPIRDLWLAAADRTAERAKWYRRLNELLDERPRLMRCRDALATA